MKNNSRDPKARAKRALELRRRGYPYKRIGEIIGKADDPNTPISSWRATQLVINALRHENPYAISGLTGDDQAKALTGQLRRSGKLYEAQLRAAGRI